MEALADLTPGITDFQGAVPTGAAEVPAVALTLANRFQALSISTDDDPESKKGPANGKEPRQEKDFQ